MIPMMMWEMEKFEWLEKGKFLDVFSFAQCIPGPIAFNTALLLGKKIAGILGAFVAGVAVIIPPFFAIVGVASIVRLFSHSVYISNFLKGCYMAIVGLLGNILWRLVKRQKWSVYKTLVVAAAAVLLYLKGSFLIAILISAFVLLYMEEAKLR